jgi:hypothetical protein
VSAEENKAILRRYVEEITNQRNLELADEIFDRYLSHQPYGSVLERGPEDVKRFIGEFRSAFPDFPFHNSSTPSWIDYVCADLNMPNH